MTINYTSPAALTRAVRVAKANPNARFDVPGDWPLTSAEVLANFQRGLMTRCNRGLDTGDDASFHELQHDARIINDAARGVRWSGRNLLRNAEMIQRYPDIHNPPREW